MTYNGTNLRVFLEGELIAGEGECSVSFSHEPRDANTKDSGRWDASAEGGLSAEVSSNGMVIYPAAGVASKKAFADLFDAFISENSVTLHFGINDGGAVDSSELNFTGEFRITSLEQTGAHRDTVTFTASFASTGEVSKAGDTIS